jgi:hypothetical protein
MGPPSRGLLRTPPERHTGAGEEQGAHHLWWPGWGLGLGLGRWLLSLSASHSMLLSSPPTWEDSTNRSTAAASQG